MFVRERNSPVGEAARAVTNIQPRTNFAMPSGYAAVFIMEDFTLCEPRVPNRHFPFWAKRLAFIFGRKISAGLDQ